MSSDTLKVIQAQEKFFVALFANDVMTKEAVKDIKETASFYHEKMMLVFGKEACSTNTHQVYSFILT